MSEPKLGPSNAQITFMSHNISARIAKTRVRRRRRIELGIAAGGVVVGIALTAAGILVTSAPSAVQATGYSCFVADDPRSNYAVMPLPGDVEPPVGDERIALALEMCNVAFERDGTEAPYPTVCELPDLRLAVFPNLRAVGGTEFCTSLGLGTPGD
ncbi:MAG TPA: hypothetical protein VNS80_03105 [Pseudolysinimonas sp.]|nr:hypothetical protein [Pseudolysinimonas sp.]